MGPGAGQFRDVGLALQDCGAALLIPGKHDMALSVIAQQVQNTRGDGCKATPARRAVENADFAVELTEMWQNIRAVSYYMSYIRLVEVQ